MTGSAMNIATVSAPSRRMAASSSSAASSPTDRPGPADPRYGYGGGTCTNPGTRGSKSGQYASRPVADIAASVVPWYARRRAMIFVLPGRPRSFQYERAILNAVSFASAPPDVKKNRLIDG